MISPYKGQGHEKWLDITKQLVEKHPLDTDEIVDVVLKSWKNIFTSKFGSKPFHIGIEIFPKPQIMGFLLHELIPLEFAERYKGKWTIEETAEDKDLVFVPDNQYSIEIKTSSNKNKIFGNRSYSQVTATSKKSKSGYYIAINFAKFTKTNSSPEITLIRFGWIDHEDWSGQTAASGQQASLSKEIYEGKLITLYSKS